jgi:hypothetical protein
VATVIDSNDFNRYEVIKMSPYNDAPTNVAITGQPISVTTGYSPSTKTPAVDAFGRMRVSNPFTLFDSQHRYQENDKWDTQLTGSATKTYVVNESTINLNCTTGSTDAVLRETKRVFPYQPGKSLLIMSTFAMATGKTNQTQRVGYYGAQNGIYLEQQGTTLYFVQRSYSSGSLVETRIPQSQWNTDKFDGTGISETIDVTKTQILWMDIEWLGVGSVRCGFVVDGTFVMAHRFDHDNIETRTYMTTAILPLRYEIFNTGTVASSSTLKQICSTVISEGGYEGFSRRYNVDTDANPVNLLSAGTAYPIIALRLNSARLDAVVLPSGLNGIVTSNNNIQYQIIINPTLTGGTWTTHYNGTVDYNTTATAVSGGNIIVGGYINNAGQIDLSSLNNFNFQLGRTIAGASDVLCLAMTGLSNNTKVLADLSWYEVV